MILTLQDLKATVKAANGDVFVRVRADGPVPGTGKCYPSVYVADVRISKIEALRMIEALRTSAPSGAGAEVTLRVGDAGDGESIILFTRPADAASDR